MREESASTGRRKRSRSKLVATVVRVPAPLLAAARQTADRRGEATAKVFRDALENETVCDDSAAFQQPLAPLP
jgi:hypothetical protein